MTAPLLDIVEHYRIVQHRNLWSDNLMMYIVYIMCEWI